MSKIYFSLDELVGMTPILELKKIEEAYSMPTTLLAKLEQFNPAGSIKDRAALEMINDAELGGALKEGGVIIEPTSGNTGIGLASICAQRGYRLIIVMPDTVSGERRQLISAYGAEICLVDGMLGMKGTIDKAIELQRKTCGSVILGQFENPSNANAHYKTTAPEIWEDTCGEFDIFISCIGTGGTISGCARYFKEKKPNIRVIGVEPASSPYITRGESGAHAIQGIGAGFIPENLDLELVDEVLTVTDDEAFESTRDLARREGLLAGISSGAALAAAKIISSRPENYGKRIVIIFPDTGERYLSVGVF